VGNGLLCGRGFGSVFGVTVDILRLLDLPNYRHIRNVLDRNVWSGWCPGCFNNRNGPSFSVLTE